MVFAEVQKIGTDIRYGLEKNVVKGLKLKARKFWGLILTFEEVIGKKTCRETFLSFRIGLNEVLKLLEICFLKRRKYYQQVFLDESQN